MFWSILSQSVLLILVIILVGQLLGWLITKVRSSQTHSMEGKE